MESKPASKTRAPPLARLHRPPRALPAASAASLASASCRRSRARDADRRRGSLPSSVTQRMITILITRTMTIITMIITTFYQPAATTNSKDKPNMCIPDSEILRAFPRPQLLNKENKQTNGLGQSFRVCSLLDTADCV